MKFPKIGNINIWESLQEKIISNLSLINDRETYDMIAKKLKEVKG